MTAKLSEFAERDSLPAQAEMRRLQSQIDWITPQVDSLLERLNESKTRIGETEALDMIHELKQCLDAFNAEDEKFIRKFRSRFFKAWEG